MIAKSVEGVTRIRSELEVEYDTSRPDFEMKAEIEEALEWDVFVDDGLIHVDVRDGKATLEGVVGSAAEKSRAITDAWVIGITDVQADGLVVERWTRDDEPRSHKYVPRSDEETRNAVGVLRLENRIRVRPANVLLDADIRTAVVDALVRDSVVESHEVDVRVRAGKVILEGEADSHFEKMHAEDVASRVSGVVSVDDELAVDYDDRIAAYDPDVDLPYYPNGSDWDVRVGPRSLHRSDDEIRREIEDELFWSAFVDADARDE